jgi:drug/metabolite transporter (DMT)-like permease
VIVGLALALACAVATSVAFLLKHRGAVLAPDVHVRHPLRSAADLFRSKWFAVGWAVALGAWALHVGALALAPLSIVQAVLSGGLVFLAVFAERFFGFRLGRRQWAGVVITAVGLAIIGLTSGSDDGEPRRYAVAALIAVECGVLVVGVAVAASSTHRRVPSAAQGLLLGAAAGALFGVSDIAIKFLADDIASGVLELISPWTAAALIASVVAFYASARGLQIGPGVEVIALTSVAANLTAIIGGILVFRDPVGTGALEITGRMLAFCLVIAGAALIPAPVRAADAPTDASGRPKRVASASNP